MIFPIAIVIPIPILAIIIVIIVIVVIVPILLAAGSPEQHEIYIADYYTHSIHARGNPRSDMDDRSILFLYFYQYIDSRDIWKYLHPIHTPGGQTQIARN